MLINMDLAMHPLLNIAIMAARQAGDILLRYRDRLDSIQTYQKGKDDLFSEVDVQAEQTIIKTIAKAYPDHGFIAEESGLTQDDAESVWIIDPLDGTNNYLHGYPWFCVSIAHRVKNKIEHAVVYDPLHQECFIATRGSGARLNDRRLRITKPSDFSNALIGTSFIHTHHQEYQAALKIIADRAAGVRKSGAVALELAYVAAGRLNGFIGTGLKPWDIAAGMLLVQEAGGLVSDFAGNEVNLTNGQIVAAPIKTFKPILQAFHTAREKAV